MDYKDYYKILGVDKKASQDEIKKGGKLIITASDQPDELFGHTNRWITSMGSVF